MSASTTRKTAATCNWWQTHPEWQPAIVTSACKQASLTPVSGNGTFCGEI
jgi:hypothetical protein